MRISRIALPLLAALVLPQPLVAEPPLVDTTSRARAPGDDATGMRALADAVRAHDDAVALARLEALPAAQRTSSPIRFLHGRLLERLGRPEHAARAYAEIPGTSLPTALAAPLEAHVLHLRARSGGCAEVQVALAARADAPGASPVDLELAGRCALAVGAHDDAVRRLSLALAHADATVDAPSLARTLAVALDALGRRDEATAALRQAFLASPEHPKADALRAELASRSAAAARLDADERATVVARLLEAREPARALALLDEVPSPTARAARTQHLHLRGQVLFAMRTRYAEAAEVLAEAARLADDRGIEDAIASARALARAGDEAAAITRYVALARRHAGTEIEARVLHLAASLALRGGRADGVERMQSFVETFDRRGGHERVAEGHYLLALTRHERGAHVRARAHLDRACRRRPEKLPREACAHLGARIDLARGEREAARAAWLALARTEPHAWYGLHARRQLAELGQDVPLPEAVAPASPPPLPLPEPVAFLAELGLVEEAALALRAHEQRSRGESLDELASYVAAYLALDDAAQAFRLAREGARRAGDDAPALAAYFVRAMHPRPYAVWLEPLAAEAGVDPAYVYGTMRQESAFVPTAESRVGALGLLQLMPSTAERAARLAGLPYETARLLEPGTNVRVALAEMRTLVARYGGRLPLVAASYNAGVEKLDGWIAARGHLPLDLFVEWIPFDETRGYVRRVVGHAARYHALDGRPLEGLRFVANSPVSPSPGSAP